MAESSTSVMLQDDAELHKVFRRFDSDGDGKISSSELRDVLCSLGSHVSPDELRDMMAEMDADGDGFVNFKEFADFHRDNGSHDGGISELRETFDLYDLDKNGLISSSELHKVLKQLGEKCSVHDCARMIKSVDSDGDGNVNFEEFKKMMTKKPIH